MSALSNIRNGLTSSGSSIVVGILIFGLVATFGGFLGEGNALSDNSPLSVNGKSISSGEFAIEFGRIDSQLSENDQSLSDEIIEGIVKESIIYKEIYAQAALEIGINIDEKKLNALIRNDPTFYNNNSFDVDLFKGFLTRLGMSPETFKEFIKSRYLASDLQNLINKKINLDQDYVRNFILADRQTRDITFSRIILSDEALKENITEKNVRAYYQDNKFLYTSPMKVSYKLIELNRESYNQVFTASEEEIESEKVAILKNFKPQKRISHIEVSYNENNKASKLKTIKDLLENLKNKSINFLDAVENYSSDLSTNKLGGDLGFTDGSIFPDEFESALSKMKKNDVSEIIDLSTSFHILKITEETNSSFTEEEISERIIFAKSSEKFEDALNYIEENIYIKDIDSLSNDIDIEIQTISEENEDSFYSTYQDLEQDELEEGNVYGPFEIDENFYVIGMEKIIEEDYEPFEQVKNKIEIQLKTSKASAKTQALVETTKKDLKEGKKEFIKYSEIKRNNLLLPSRVTQKLFSYEVKINEIFSLILENGDAYIVKLDKINKDDRVISSEELNQSKEYLSSLYQEIIRESFTNTLRDNSRVN